MRDLLSDLLRDAASDYPPAYDDYSTRDMVDDLLDRIEDLEDRFEDADFRDLDSEIDDELRRTLLDRMAARRRRDPVADPRARARDDRRQEDRRFEDRHEPVDTDLEAPIAQTPEPEAPQPPEPVIEDIINERFSSIEEKLSRIAEAQQKTDTNADREALDERLSALASRIETRIHEESRSDELSALRGDLAAMGNRGDAEQLSQISDRLDGMRDIRAEIAQISERLDQPSAAPTGLVDEIRQVADRIDAIPAHSQAAFERIAQNLSQQIDQTSSSTVNSISSAVNAIREEIEPLKSAGAAPDLSSIEHAIAEIHRRLDTAGQEELGALRAEIEQMRNGLMSAVGPNLSGLEARLADLSQHVQHQANVPAAPDNSAALHAVEQQIAALARDIGEARTQAATPGPDLQPLFADLAQRIDASRAEAVAAARTAVEQAMGQMAPQAGGDNDAAMIRTLQNEIRQARHSSDESDKRNQAMLESVHDSLRKMVDRLGSLEQDVTDMRGRMQSAGNQQAAPAQPQTAAPQRQARQAAPAQPEAPKPDQAKAKPAAPSPQAKDVPAGRPAPAPQQARRAPEPKVDGAAPTAAKPQPGKPEGTRPTAPDMSIDNDMPIPPGGAAPTRVETPAAETAPSDYIAAARRAARAAVVEESEQQKDKPRGLAGLIRRKNRKDPAIDAGQEAPVSDNLPSPREMREERRQAAKAARAEKAAKRKEKREEVGEKGTSKLRKALIYGVSLTVIAFGAWQAYNNFLASGSSKDESQVGIMSAPMGENAPGATQNEGNASEPSVAPDANEPSVSPSVSEPTVSPPRQSAAPEKPRQIEIGQLPAIEAPAEQAAEAEKPVVNSDPKLASLPSNFPKALSEAAIGGDPLARYEVAHRYSVAQNVPQDLEAAATWFQAAAGQGHAPSQFRLASLFEKGNGVPRDITLAKHWYERAASQGNRRAMHNLAVILADNSEGKGDYDAASGWFRQAGELGLRDSQYNLGILYARGMGVDQDLKESYKWFSIAAEAGDTEAGSKAQDLASRMDAQTLAQSKLAARNWKAQPLDELANATNTDGAPWNTDTTASIPTEGAALVRHAQELLITQGYDIGQADGIAGAKTRAAVREFQKASGLPANGNIDSFLVNALANQ